MYLHIVPQLFHLMANKCHLESIAIPELDLKIEGDALSTADHTQIKISGLG